MPRVTQYESYHVTVEINRPADLPHNVGQQIIDLWMQALMSDLFGSLNSPRSVQVQAPVIARKGRVWCKDALIRRLGTEYGPFELAAVHVLLFPKRDCQGALLADINVLAGTYALR